MDNNIEKPLMHIILDGRKLMLNFKKVKIQHIFREANRVAYMLANDAVSLEEHFIILVNPAQNVYKNISFDYVGKTQNCT